MGDKTDGPLELRVYPGSECGGSVYFDDGDSFGYKQGLYARLNISCENKTNSLVINLAPVEGSYLPEFKELQLTIGNAGSGFKSAMLNGNKTRLKTAGKQKLQSVNLPWSPNGASIIFTK